LKVEVREWETEGLLNKNPSLYPQTAIYSIYLLMMRQSKRPKETNEHIISRLSQIPRFMADAQNNLNHAKQIPRVWALVASEFTKGGLDFLKNNCDAFAKDLRGKAQERFLAAATKAIEAFEKFDHFLKTSLISSARGKFISGKETLQFIIHTKHHLPYSCEQILEMGQELISSTIGEIEKIAKIIDPTQHWKDIIEELKGHHPQENELLKAYGKKMMEVKEYIMKNDLLTLPANERLHIVHTPKFERATIAHAAIVPCAPYDELQESFFWVTPVEKDLDIKLKARMLADHSYYIMPVTVVHEAYPGHHVQISYAAGVKSPVKKFIESELMNEGWAVYCEEMMMETGFISEPKEILFKLKNQLWRACRVVIDIQLHTGKITFDEAVNMLVDTVKMDRINAEIEVKRYTLNPGQPLTYSIGKQEILRIRQQYQKKMGSNYRLKDFHNQFLSYGSIPVPAIAKAMELEG
jgi:uncharacterized protein (DUF885 family)